MHSRGDRVYLGRIPLGVEFTPGASRSPDIKSVATGYGTWNRTNSRGDRVYLGRIPLGVEFTPGASRSPDVKVRRHRLRNLESDRLPWRPSLSRENLLVPTGFIPGVCPGTAPVSGRKVRRHKSENLESDLIPWRPSLSREILPVATEFTSGESPRRRS